MKKLVRNSGAIKIDESDINEVYEKYAFAIKNTREFAKTAIEEAVHEIKNKAGRKSREDLCLLRVKEIESINLDDIESEFRLFKLIAIAQNLFFNRSIIEQINELGNKFEVQLFSKTFVRKFNKNKIFIKVEFVISFEDNAMGWCRRPQIFTSEQRYFSAKVAISLNEAHTKWNRINKEWILSVLEHEMAHALDMTKDREKGIEKLYKARASIFSSNSTDDDLIEYYNDPTEIVARLREYSNLLKRNFLQHEDPVEDPFGDQAFLNEEDKAKPGWFNKQISKIKSDYRCWKHLTQENKNKFLSVLYSEWQKLCGKVIESKVQNYIAKKRTPVVARYLSISISR